MHLNIKKTAMQVLGTISMIVFALLLGGLLVIARNTFSESVSKLFKGRKEKSNAK